MAQIVKLSVNVLALAADQVVPHGLERTPDWIFIVEKNDLTGPKKALYAQCFTAVGAAMGTATLAVQMAAAAAYLIGGAHYAVGITDNYFDLTGFDVTNGMYNLCLLCIDSAGNDQIGVGTEAAALADVVLPDTPADSCVVAMLEIHPTGAGDFEGGVTPLNDGGVIPTPVYTDLSGHPDLFGEVTLGSAADPTNIYVDNSMASARAVEIIAACLHSIIA